jgi:ribosome biogenesis GTPase
VEDQGMNIERLGYDGWFKERTDIAKLADFQIARVITVHKNSYVISKGEGYAFAETTGKMMFNADSPLDYPAAGDWVYAQFFDDDSFAVIHEIFPRRSLLKRKTSGKKIEFQIIAANIDTAMIIQSLDTDYNIRRLERYLVMINESSIHPVILLSKSDLLTSDEIETKTAAVQKAFPGVQATAYSTINESGLSVINKMFIPGKTYCLLGSSGVGKTTLLNHLIGEELFETQIVREKNGKGKHTTARRQLINLKNGAMVIDTPGIRELGNIAVDTGLSETFNEITGLADLCRYSDCTHTVEKGCAVLTAVEDGKISIERYQNYLKMKKESDYHEMSYLEKRRKDKEFGKIIKLYMKHKKNHK